MATDDEVSQPDAGGRTLTDTHTTRQAAARTRDRIARRQVDKFTERREQLAAAALATLAEQGYARTSLRDIAQHSNFSHGVLHYYFADKVELITFCVRKYKAKCATRYDELVAGASSAEQLRAEISAAMAATLNEDATLQRLWYDLRNQALFEERFRAPVQEIDRSLEQMIWRIVTRYAELSGAVPAFAPSVAYALMDGLFRHALVRYLSGDIDACRVLDANVWLLLPELVC
jgi:AcrR family transcriptional regulator